MKTAPQSKTLLNLLPILALICAASCQNPNDNLPAEPTATSEPAAPGAPTITINADQVKGHSSPILYGIMTEDINYCLDGGLYGELIANRTYQEPAANPKRWSLIQDPGASGTMEFDKSQTLNDKQPISLRLTATTASTNQRVGFANEGYWGIPVRPNTTYQASFYAKADGSFTGPLTIAISSTTSPVTYAYATVPKLTNDWKKYEVTLKTDGTITPTKDANFLIWTTSPGTAWFSIVSLFPPTYNNHPNGNRPDLMKLLADYHPAFLRFPGGNFLEGHTIATRFDWKRTVGDISERPGHANDSWNYYSDDGLGLLEYLEWCEDIKMEPLLAVYSGLALGGGEVAPGPDLAPFVQDALDEIEYITGDVNTKWGALRAKNGHPAPFKLTYIEIGNEDWRGNYDGRFSQFYDAIKAKYPNLQLIDASTHNGLNNTNRETSRIATTNTTHQPDVIDSHLYTSSELESDARSTDYDKYDRTGPKLFEGEWATRVGTPTPNFTGALGDAAFMTGLERNSDIVIMASYAPLFVNVSNAVAGRGNSQTSMQWASDLIGYDALNSYGSPAYYAQVMFNNNRGDEILGLDSQNIPTRAGPPAANNAGRRGAVPAGATPAAPPPTPRQIPAMFFSTTRDSKTGVIYVKAVNPLATATPLHVNIKGVNSIAPIATSIVMKAENLTDTNSISDPTKIVPVTTRESGYSASFTRTLPPYSITILKLQSR